ncbi:hypothetical protein BCR34DRAFT_259211 [Clohesyomyces aquaticus]|uniref:Uncharacterized protein n=1 Tax=Clohesyomyces aquaticus TaxID=1231657 RepID=A0A1Y2A939_9PLEO|nr:hypothetical protein BCR34DRAFT_259211 [Clohesyomyces aquaticus]
MCYMVILLFVVSYGGARQSVFPKCSQECINSEPKSCSDGDFKWMCGKQAYILILKAYLFNFCSLPDYDASMKILEELHLHYSVDVSGISVAQINLTTIATPRNSRTSPFPGSTKDRTSLKGLTSSVLAPTDTPTLAILRATTPTATAVRTIFGGSTKSSSNSPLQSTTSTITAMGPSFEKRSTHRRTLHFKLPNKMTQRNVQTK